MTKGENKIENLFPHIKPINLDKQYLNQSLLQSTLEPKRKGTSQLDI